MMATLCKLHSLRQSLNQSFTIIGRSCSTKVKSEGQTKNDASFYNEEQRELQHSVRKLIDTHINPNVDEWETNGAFPTHKIFKLLGEAGFLGINKPIEYGGLGLSYKYALALNEALGSIRCGAIPMAITVQTDMATPALSRFGSDYLKQEFLTPSISGDFVSAIGVSEPGSGSDVASIKTTAQRQGDDLIINGQKMWITNGFEADWICLLANTSTNKSPHLNKSLICVPMNAPGVTRSKKIDKLGMRSSDTALLYFEDVRVPAKNVIGKEGHGFTYQMMQFQEERMVAGVLSLEPMEMVIKETIDYTKQRIAFNQPLINNQVIHFRLAELQTEVECLRSILYRAAELYENGEDVTKLASMVKLKAGRLSREVTDSCLQYWGGMGFTNEVLVSRLYRDLRLLSIGGGADEVMLGIICKYMDILPKMK